MLLTDKKSNHHYSHKDSFAQNLSIVYYVPSGPVKPSCLQATLASLQLQEEPQTEYHWLDLHIWSNPCFGLLPYIRRSSVVQAALVTKSEIITSY